VQDQELSDASLEFHRLIPVETNGVSCIGSRNSTHLPEPSHYCLIRAQQLLSCGGERGQRGKGKGRLLSSRKSSLSAYPRLTEASADTRRLRYMTTKTKTPGSCRTSLKPCEEVVKGRDHRAKSSELQISAINSLVGLVCRDRNLSDTRDGVILSATLPPSMHRREGTF